MVNTNSTKESIKRVIDNSDQTISELRKNPKIESIEPGYIVHTDFTPNDSFTYWEWALNNTGQNAGVYGKDIKAFTAWNVNQGSNNMVVAVLDSGVQTNHPDLVNKFYRDGANNIIGYDFSNGDSDANDDNGHGTHVAGTIGAQSNNSVGVAGVCPNCKIMPVKFLDYTGSGSTSDAISAIYFAVNNGAKVINNSWGGAPYNSVLQSAIDYAYNNGVIVVASAGNDNTSIPAYPAAYNHVISVASTDSSDRKSSFSNYGSWVDVSAPGSSILSTILTGANLGGSCSDASFAPASDGYGYCSGTSMSAPIVSGVAALIASQYPTYTPDQIKSQIKNTADNIDASNPAYIGQIGLGRVNAYRALTTQIGPNLKYISHQVSDSLANNNQIFEPGEKINLSVNIGNDWGTAINTNATLTTLDTPYFAIKTPTISLGNINNAAQVQANYEITVNTITPTPRTSTFNLNLTANNGYIKKLTFTIDILKPLPIPQTWDFASTNQNWTTTPNSLWHLSDYCAPYSVTAPPRYFHYGKVTCGNYDNGSTNQGKLYSPPIKGLGNTQNTYLSFDQLIETENFPSYDKAMVKVKLYGSDDSTAITLGGPFSNSISGWENKKFAIPLSISSSQAFQIFFDFDSVDSLSNVYKGWFIDNVKVLSSLNSGDVLISEINWAGSAASTDDYFVELYNSTNTSIDLKTYYLENIAANPAQNLTFSTGAIAGLGNCTNTIIPAKSYFLISKYSKLDAKTLLNIDSDCVIPSLDLSGSGKQISLKTPAGLVIDQSPTGNWAAGTKTNCLTSLAAAPCFSMSRDITATDGTQSNSWFSSNISSNVDSPYTYITDSVPTRTTWIAPNLKSGEKMTPKAPNGNVNPANSNTINFCASDMQYIKAVKAVVVGSICPKVISEYNYLTTGYFLTNGPFISNLSVGQTYTATFRLKAAGVGLNSNLAAKLDVVDSSGNILGYANLNETDFYPGNFITKNVVFTVPNNQNIETRIYIIKDNLSFTADQITLSKGVLGNQSWIYESEDQVNSPNTSTIYTDAQASNTKGRAAVTAGYLQVGPSTTDQAGGSWYSATYRLKADYFYPTSPDLNYLTLEVNNTDGAGLIGRRAVKYSELSTLYKDFTVYFFRPDNTGTLDYKIKLNNSNLKVYADNVTVTKLSIAPTQTITLESEISGKTIGSEVRDGITDVRSSTSNADYMVLGPDSNDLASTANPGNGNYTATFYLKNISNTLGNIAEINVTNDRGSSTQILATQIVTSSMLNYYSYMPITLTFSRADLIGTLEFKVKNLNSGKDLRVDKIVIKKL